MSESQPLIAISRKHAFTFAGFLVLYQFLTYIANDMILPGMIHVVQSFRAPESAIATSLTAYILGGASLQLFLGPLSDRYGRRPIMLAGAFLFMIFTLAIGCSQSIEQFLTGRFFEGMGLCFISVIGYTTLQEIFSEMDAVRLIAILANISTIAPLLGPLVGAALLMYISWRDIFFIIAFAAFIALWGLWRYMPETVGTQKRDGSIIPPISLSLKDIAKNYGILLKNPAFLFGSFGIGFLAVPCLAWIAISPIMLITDARLSLVHYGLWQIPVFGADIIGNLVLRRLTYHYSLPEIIAIGAVVTISGLFLSLLLAWIFHGAYLAIIAGLVLYALGLGISTGPLSRKVLYSTHVTKGTASALMSILIMGIEAGGVEVVNLVYLDHNHLHFSLFCFITGIAFLCCLLMSVAFQSDERQQEDYNIGKI